MEKDEIALKAHTALQDSIENWGRLLISTGGAFKPIKCFYHLLSFCWLPDGRWAYKANEETEAFDLRVPMTDGSFVPIEHLSVDTGNETLGFFSCPSGKACWQLDYMRDKAQKWFGRAKEGRLRQWDVWFLLDNQLWPKVSYGLCSVLAPWKELGSMAHGAPFCCCWLLSGATGSA